MTYRVREPLQLIYEQLPKPLSFVEIAPGSLITIQGEVQTCERVDVIYQGRMFAASRRDIEARADLV